MMNVAGVHDVEAAMTMHDGAAALLRVVAKSEQLIERMDLVPNGHHSWRGRLAHVFIPSAWARRPRHVSVSTFSAVKLQSTARSIHQNHPPSRGSRMDIAARDR